jgi:hypothetical protein
MTRMQGRGHGFAPPFGTECCLRIVYYPHHGQNVARHRHTDKRSLWRTCREGVRAAILRARSNGPVHYPARMERREARHRVRAWTGPSVERHIAAPASGRAAADTCNALLCVPRGAIRAASGSLATGDEMRA